MNNTLTAMQVLANGMLMAFFTRLLFASRKIEAVKLYRALTDCALRDARDVIDAFNDTKNDDGYRNPGFCPDACNVTRETVSLHYLDERDMLRNVRLMAIFRALINHGGKVDAMHLYMALTGCNVESTRTTILEWDLMLLPSNAMSESDGDKDGYL